MEITDLNTALTTLNKIEDTRDTLRNTYEKRDAKLKEAKEQVEAYLMEEMKRLNLTAFEAPGEGVASIKIKRRFGCGDWGTFWNWITENKCPNILQKRILDSEMQTYLDSSGGLPPGVSTEAKQVIIVTKRPPK
jgi:hypothetical protein